MYMLERKDKILKLYNYSGKMADLLDLDNSSGVELYKWLEGYIVEQGHELRVIDKGKLVGVLTSGCRDTLIYPNFIFRKGDYIGFIEGRYGEIQVTTGGKLVDLNNANELYMIIENELYVYGIFRLLRWE